MDKEFYHLAVRLMENIGRVEPNLVSGHDAEMCIILTDQQHVYAGITGVRISNGQLMRACPEFNAIMSMVPNGESRVEKMITVSFAHHSVSPPCEGCLDLLLRVNAENKDTMIYDTPNHFVNAETLLSAPSFSERLADVFFFSGAGRSVAAPEPSNAAAGEPAPAAGEPAPAAGEPAPAAEDAPEITVQEAPMEMPAVEPPAEETPVVSLEKAPEEAPAEEPNPFAEETPAEETPVVSLEKAPEEAPAEEPNPFAEDYDEAAPPVTFAADNPFAAETPAEEIAPVNAINTVKAAEDAFGPADGLAATDSTPPPPAVLHSAGIPDAAALELADAIAAAEREQNPDAEQDQFAQFGFEAGDPVDFVEEVRHDTDNPFYEPPAEPVTEEEKSLPLYMRDPRKSQPRYLYEQPDSQALMQQPAMGYDDPAQRYASQSLPGSQVGMSRRPFQPAQAAAMRSQQQSQYVQSQQLQSQPFQPGQQSAQQQSFQPGQSQPFQPMQSQPFRPGQPQQSQPFRPGQSQPSQPFRPGQSQPSQPFRPGQSQQQSQYVQSQPFQPQPYLQGQSVSYQSVPLQQGQTQPIQQVPLQPYQGTAQTFRPGQSDRPARPGQLQGGYVPPQQSSKRESGSAFRQRLSAFMSDDDGSGETGEMTSSELKRLAKEKKKKAKIDAKFKKDMKKKGF